MFENIATIYLKEFRQLKRDKLSLSAIILVPTLMLLLYGYALNFDVKHVRLGILDESMTKESRELQQKFFSTEYFDFAGTVPDEGAIDKFIQDGKAKAVLVIPRDYAREILLGRKVDVQVLLDGANSNTATIVMGYVEGILQNYSANLTARYLDERGIHISSAGIDYRPRVYYNPELKSAKFLVPGLIGFILMILSIVTPAISVVREKERGTLEHISMAPTTSLEIILGKTTLYFVLSLAAAVLVISASFVLFDVTIRGSILLLAVTIVIFLIGTLGIGILISTFTNSQQMAFLVASLLSILPTFILSGFVFPINSMALPLQLVTYFLPGRYFLSALRAIMLKGSGFGDIYTQIYPLLIFAVVVPAFASIRLSRKGF
ncbi:MAG: ABC transporter permease [Bacteroidetes bacterium]|nr:ABC transporter permease [Bacteroidota bacterium]